MRRLKIYVTTGYFSFLLVAVVSLFAVAIYALSFNPFNMIPTPLGAKFIDSLEHISDKTRLTMIAISLSLMFTLLCIGAYLMRILLKNLKMLTHNMNAIIKDESQLNYAIKETPYQDINLVIRSFNAMTFTMNNTLNQLKKEIYYKNHMLSQTQTNIRNNIDELKNLKIDIVLSAKSQLEFIENMYHELRTPLNAIIGYSELLKENSEESGFVAYVTDLDKIIDSANHVLIQVNKTLESSRGHPKKMVEHIK